MMRGDDALLRLREESASVQAEPRAGVGGGNGTTCEREEWKLPVNKLLFSAITGGDERRANSPTIVPLSVTLGPATDTHMMLLVKS